MKLINKYVSNFHVPVLKNPIENGHIFSFIFMPMTMRNKLSEKPTLEPSPLQLPRVHCTLHGMEGVPLQMPRVQCGVAEVRLPDKYPISRVTSRGEAAQ